MNKKLKIALISGGKSGEREISLKGARKIEKAFKNCGHEVVNYDPLYDLIKLAKDSKKLDVAFILLHGKYGEDGTMQGYLDLLGLPYQGSNVLGSAMAMDKHIAKTIYTQAGLKTPSWISIKSKNEISRINTEELKLPQVIKPARQGSSLGMTIARSQKEIETGIIEAFKYDQEVLLEQYIRGREITCSVLGNEKLEALPLIEIIPGKEHPFFNYEAKYSPGASLEICPAELSETEKLSAQNIALQAHEALKLRGYSRSDMILADTFYLIETNTIPGMTQTSLLPQAAAKHGFTFEELLEKLIEFALE
jgi:D-alanine-D-alanine ligase